MSSPLFSKGFALNRSGTAAKKEDSSSGHSSESLEEESNSSVDEEDFEKLGLQKPSVNSDSDSDLDSEEKKHRDRVMKNLVSKTKRLTDTTSLENEDLERILIQRFSQSSVWSKKARLSQA